MIPIQIASNTGRPKCWYKYVPRFHQPPVKNNLKTLDLLGLLLISLLHLYTCWYTCVPNLEHVYENNILSAKGGLWYIYVPAVVMCNKFKACLSEKYHL